ncbi:hypothetical protein GGI07_004994 [Coemansia sp. Benny D115]|nr:hypothetical protein GGI07_004994 [Coemansia sp. Benny D115]
MASDIVFISQQQEILNSIKPNPQSQLHTQTPQWPSAPTQNSYATANSPSGDKQLSSEFIAHMELSAQELKGICDMLTETLIALNIEEDPVANPVVQDMLSEVKQRYV